MGGKLEVMQRLRPIDVSKGVLAASATLFLLYLVYLLRTPLTWIVVAGFLAVALHPPVSVLTRWMPRGLAVTLVMLVVAAAGALVLLLLVPPLLEQGGALVNRAPGWVETVRAQLEHSQLLSSWEQRYQLTAHLQDAAHGLSGHAQGLVGGLLGVAGAVAEQLIGAVTILVMSVFMLMSGPRWAQWLVAQAPASRRAQWQATTDHLGEAVSGYLLGNLLISLVCGLGSWLVLMITGVPYAAALAVLVALLDLLPLVGSLLGGILVGLVTLFVDFPTASIIWTVWTVVYQQLENHLLQPQIYKRTVNVHPLLVIIAVLFGTTLLGILGALIAIPTAATLQVMLRNWWHSGGRQELLDNAAGNAPPRD